MLFIQELIESIREKKSVVCMGLDPRMEQRGEIPEYFKKEFQHPNKIIFEFNKKLIDATYDLIPIIKPQIAFYEKYDALEALKQTIKYAHKKNLLVLLDSKRNDIGSTSKAYAEALFDLYKADAVTINAYFGIDGVKPFLEYKEKGIFVLVKTSNPSSAEFQDLFSVRFEDISNDKINIAIHELPQSIELKRNYIQMAELVNKWGLKQKYFQNYHNLGVVVGATYPTELNILRKLLTNSFFLIPGYGAQGATAKEVKYGFDGNGLGAIINSSRGIMFAYNNDKKYSPEHFDQAARNEIMKMNKEISKQINLS